MRFIHGYRCTNLGGKMLTETTGSVFESRYEAEDEEALQYLDLYFQGKCQKCGGKGFKVKHEKSGTTKNFQGKSLFELCYEISKKSVAVVVYFFIEQTINIVWYVLYAT